MDITAIGSYNPNRINWQNLTAKQIMKFHDAGVEVPSVYFKWAQDFINSVNAYSQDDVTYERATTISTENKEKANTASEVNPDANAQDTSAETDTLVPSQTEITPNGTTNNEPDKEDAAEKQSNVTGVQVLNLAMASNNSSKDCDSAIQTINSASDTSTAELQALENDMKALISEAASAQAEFKNQIKMVNSGKSKNGTVDKINELQEKLQNYGNSGYQRLGDFETKMSENASDIQDQESTLFNAIDIGTSSVNAETELLNDSTQEFFLSKIIDKICAKYGISKGSKAIDSGTSGMEIQNSAIQNVNTNLSASVDYYSEIEDNTGVTASQQSETENGKNEKDKNIKSSQNDGKDNTDKQNTNIDEILKRKVRKGVQLEN